MNRAADLGVSVQAIGAHPGTLLGARASPPFCEGGREYEVILQATRRSARDARATSTQHPRALGPNRAADPAVEPGDDAGDDRRRAINRFDRIRAITISAGLAPGYRWATALDYLERVSRGAARLSPRSIFTGESRELKSSPSTVYFAFGLALVVVFLVLAAQFEAGPSRSSSWPTVPLAVFGALLGARALGLTASISTPRSASSCSSAWRRRTAS